MSATTQAQATPQSDRYFVFARTTGRWVVKDSAWGDEAFHSTDETAAREWAARNNELRRSLVSDGVIAPEPAPAADRVITLAQRLADVLATIAGLEYQARHNDFDPQDNPYDRGTQWYLDQFLSEAADTRAQIAVAGPQATWKIRTYGCASESAS